MRKRMRAVVVAALPVSVVTLVAAVLPAGTAAASRPGAMEKVTLALAPADPAGLRALAHAGSVPHSERLAALASVIPSTRERAAVVSAVRTLGLTVTGESRWAVHVIGRATRIRALFGSARGNNPHFAFAQNLPFLPATLHGWVTAALGGDDTRPAARPLGAVVPGAKGTGGWVGSDLQQQYGVAMSGAAGHQTIATVQLSDWSPSDLGTYVAGEGQAACAYTGIKDPNEPPTLDPSNSSEVDLDQEAICSTDPTASQRAYISANNLGGEIDDLYAIGDDASNPLTDGAHITAASISWGGCEEPTPSPLIDAFENALQYVLASGVTVFAATGDFGADCDPNGTTGISYPASSPEVVAVGGTELDSPGTTTLPATEHAWSGSGGGSSALFYQPSWQANDGLANPRRTTPDISALAGAPGFEMYSSTDPQFSTAPTPGWLPFGGTSLASPVSAALFTDVLAEHGYSWGIGDIHPALYAKARYSGTPTFTDIASGLQGNGGVQATTGYDTATGLGTPLWDALVPQLGGDPHLTVQFFNRSTSVPVTVQTADFQSFQGYRLELDQPASCGAFGLSTTKPTSADFSFELAPGEPTSDIDGAHTIQLLAVDQSNSCHYYTQQVFLDSQAPTIHASIGLTSPTSGAHVTARWSFADPAPSSGLGRFVVSIRNQAGSTVYSTVSTTATSVTIPSAQGSTYTVSVTGYDNAGNAGVGSAKFAVPVDDTHFTYSTHWSSAANSQAYGGSYHYSATAGALTHYTATAHTYTIWFTTSTNGGNADVYIGSTLVKVVNLYSSSTHYRVPVTVYSSSTLASREVVIKVAGTKVSASHGDYVWVDALQPLV